MNAPDLSFLSGIPIGTLQKYVNGQRNPKAAALAALGTALGRPAGDFYLETPPAPRPYRKPAFGLRILDEAVEEELLKRAQDAIDELNAEHAAKMAKKDQKRPRVYVSSMPPEESDEELPGRRPEERHAINVGLPETRAGARAVARPDSSEQPSQRQPDPQQKSRTRR